MAAFGETLREFGVKISLAFDRQKVDQVTQKIEKLGADMRRFSLEVGGAAAAIFEFGNLSSSNARNLQQNADLLGLNVENLQELAYAAKVAAGVSREELVGALESVSETMDKARHGDVMASEGMLRLAQAGIGADKMLQLLQTRGTTSEQVMMALSQSFKNIKDPMAAARLATEAFGGAGAKLLPFLKRGPEGIAALRKEGRALGVIIPKSTIDQAAEMDRQFTRLGEVFKNVGYTIGFEVLKYMKPLTQEFLVWIQHNKKFIAQNIAVTLKEMAKVIVQLVKYGVEFAHVLGKVIDYLGGTKKAVDILLAAFLLFKGITFASSLIGFFGSLGTIIGFLLPSLSTLIGVMVSLKSAFSVFSMLGGLADVIPALTLFGEALAGAFLPLLPYVAAIGALAVAIHDIWALLNDKPTWTGEAFSKVGEWFGKAKGFFGVGGGAKGPAGGGATARAFSAVGASAGGAGDIAQTYNMTSNINVGVPPGTTATQATGIVSRAATDSHDKMMMKTKTDALRARKH